MLKKYGLLLTLVLVLTCAGIVYADQGVSAVPETQGLVTTTSADVVGMASETDAVSWSITSGGIPVNGTDPVIANYPGWAAWAYDGKSGYDVFLDNWNWWLLLEENPDSLHVIDMLDAFLVDGVQSGPATSSDVQDLIHWLENQGSVNDLPLNDYEVRYTTAYDASIFSQAGHIVINKGLNLNTGNKLLSQSNLKATTGLTYIATGDGGNVMGSENLLLDGAGMTTPAVDRVLCPFAAAGANYIPAYCNIIQTGSRFDLTVGSVTTEANNRFVGTDATNPVVQNYNINVKPYGTTSGQIPATGSTSAYIRTHIQEARAVNSIPDVINQGAGYPTSVISQPPLKAEDLQYSETSSASGTISKFSKSMAYSSQFTGSSSRGFHTIYASSQGGAGISPSGPVTVPEGGSQTFLFSHIGSPNLFGVDGFQVSIDGAPFTHWVDSYTFSNVISDHSIIVRVPA